MIVGRRRGLIDGAFAFGADALAHLDSDILAGFDHASLDIDKAGEVVTLVQYRDLAGLLTRHHLLLDVLIDDQDHTHESLKNGDVMGCVSTQKDAMRGCLAEPLGVVRYQCVAAPAVAARCQTKGGAVSVHRLLSTPAVIFNRKDALQDTFLAQHFKLLSPQYPRHFVPAVDAFESALEHGLGWGMVPGFYLRDRHGKQPLHELLPGSAVDVALYWHHWEHEPLSAQRMTQAVKKAAREVLL